jgi:hypothetical protein
MFVPGRCGLKSFDNTNPLAPKLLEWLGDGNNDPTPPDGHRGGATPNLMARQGLLDDMWENEDMDVDQDRKLVFLSRDPRAYPGTAVGGSNTNPNHIAGVYVIDVRHPEKLTPLSFVRLPGGHTTTCINGCKWLWTGGPAATTTQRADLGWNGRPIFVTDMRDPHNPVAMETPVDLSRNHGTTDYAHDVQVDGEGVAWVSGNGGVRGYWTKGLHYDPVLGQKRVATAFDPVPYAGGALAQSTVPIRNAAHPGGSRFMHNAWRPTGKDAPDPSYGNLIYTTEEAINGANNGLGYNACQNDGPLIIASLDNSYDGQAWKSTTASKFELTTVATWHPFGKEGSSTSTDCSAHYFQITDRILSMSFYSQGARFLDISDPTNPTQIGYFRPGTTTWATYPHKGLYYSADSQGVYVLRLTAKAGELAAGSDIAAAGFDIPEADPFTEELAALERPDGYQCAIPILLD